VYTFRTVLTLPKRVYTPSTAAGPVTPAKYRCNNMGFDGKAGVASSVMRELFNVNEESTTCE
jgi:hypothetical protein